MELSVIGAGPAYTDRRGAAAASYLVRAEGAALLLDMGQGSFPNLASTIEPSSLAAVLVSHLHPDHFVDLVPLRHYLRYEFDPPRRVRVLGPAGLGDRLDALHALPGFAAASLDVERLVPGELRIGPFAIEARRVAHTDESYAMRVSLADSSAPGPRLLRRLRRRRGARPADPARRHPAVGGLVRGRAGSPGRRAPDCRGRRRGRRRPGEPRVSCSPTSRWATTAATPSPPPNRSSRARSSSSPKATASRSEEAEPTVRRRWAWVPADTLPRSVAHEIARQSRSRALVGHSSVDLGRHDGPAGRTPWYQSNLANQREATGCHP